MKETVVVTGLVPCAEKIVRKRLPGNVRLKSDSQPRDLFIPALLPILALTLAHALALIYFGNIERFEADRVYRHRK